MVANLSSYPDVGVAASALAGVGRLRRYHVPVATTPVQERWLKRLTPAAVHRPLVRELSRRPVPPAVPGERIARTAPVADLARVAAGRLGVGVNRFTLGHREAFDRAVARRLGDGDRGLLAVHGSATSSLRRARELGVTNFVSVRLNDMDWVRELLQEEARLRPEYAATLQGHDLPERALARHREDLALADRVLALSEQARTTLINRGVPPEKLSVAPLGVDTVLFMPRPRVPDGVFRIVFVGQITQRKGIAYLVEAFRQVAIPGSELLFVGDVIGTSAPWRDVPGVRYVPAMPRAELPAVYATADVYVLPSLAEGSPLTAMEAMASGLPPILTGHSHAPELIDDGVDGYVVPIRDAGAIADRLLALHRDPDLRACMGRAARTTIEAHPWERYGEEVARIVADTLPG